MFAKLGLGLVLALGTIAAIQFVSADPEARSVYNLGVDTAEYDRLAWSLAQRPDFRGIPPTQPPGFISFLALVYRVFGHSYLAAKLTLCALLAVTSLLVALVVWRTVGKLEAVIAAALTIFSPALVAYAATLQYEVVAATASIVVTALALLWSPARASGQARFVRAVALGTACAVAACVREVLVLLFPILILDIVRQSGRQWRSHATLAIVAWMTLGLAAPLTAWTVVQYRSTGTWVLLSTKSDVNLSIGNNPAANGAYHLQLRRTQQPSGWAYIIDNPKRTAELALRKAAYFWGVLRDPWTVPTQMTVLTSRLLFQAVRYDRVLAGSYAAVVALFLAGTVVIVRRWPAIWIMPASVMVVMALHLVYFSSPRFALPVQPQIHAVVAIALGAGLRAGLRRPVAGAGVAAVAVLWMGLAYMFSGGGSYLAEAEALNGRSADNVIDSVAENGEARFGTAVEGRRSVVLIAAEAFPRGAFGLRVRARTNACAEPGMRVAELRVRGARNVHLFSQVLTAGDLCDGTYRPASLMGIVRDDNVLSISVDSLGTADLWVDRLEIYSGYREIRQVRRILE